MQAKFILILTILLVGGNSFAQNSGIKGSVIDAYSKEFLIGASIKVNDTGVITDLNGQFDLGLAPGIYEVITSYIGYSEKSIPIEVKSGQFVTLDIQLSLSSTLLDAATVTGSRHEKSVARSAVSISVIKPRLADNTNTTRISTLLDKVPGVQIIDNQANIRGGSGWSFGAGSRVLLLIDDVPALQGDAGRPAWGDIPVENISQIEILKGAASTLYGSAALNGIINIRTGYATSEPVTKANIAYTYYDSPKDSAKKWWTSAPYKVNAGLLHKQKFGDLDLVASAYYEDFKSYYIDAFEEKLRGSLNLKYRLTDKISFGLNSMVNVGKAADHFIWQNGGPGIYQGYNGTYSSRKFQRYYLDPQMTIFDKNDNRHKIIGRYYFINNDNNNGQANSSDTYYGEYQYLKSFDDIELNITVGAVGQFITSDSELLQDTTVGHKNLSQYIEFDKKIGDNLTATFGLRHEYHVQTSEDFDDGKDSESKLISRAALNYQLGQGTFLRTSWGQGYRFPTIVERFITTAVGGFFIFPNPELKSEFGWSTELGIKQGFRFGAFEGYADVSVFWSQYSDMTEFTLLDDGMGSFGFQSQNVGETDIKGFEFEFLSSSKIGKVDLNIISGYTYINPKYENFTENLNVFNSISKPVGEDEKRNVLKYRNKHNFKIDIEATYSKLSMGLAMNSSSATETIDELLNVIGQIKFYRDANPGGYKKFDARMSYQFPFMKISFLTENLFNNEIVIRPGLLEAPRTFGMRCDFNL